MTKQELDELFLQAKAKLPIPGRVPEHDKSVRSPFRPNEDQQPSFSIYEGGMRFKDHGGGGWSGDNYDFFKAWKFNKNPKELSPIEAKEAFKAFLQLAGLEPIQSKQPVKPLDFDGPTRALNRMLIAGLCEHRGYSQQCIEALKAQQKIGFGQAYGNNAYFFPIYDRAGNIVRFHCRYIDQSKGSWVCWPKNDGKISPLIFGDLLNATEVHISESTWDGIDFWDKAQAYQTDGVAL